MDLKVLPVTVQAQTVTKLRDAILSGIFQPGERLVESDLCQRMGVSRTSIREALRRLEAERLVTIIPNRGPSVTEIGWESAREIYEVRALLEGQAAAAFAERASAAELDEMRRALADFEAAVAENDPLKRLTTTERFYKVIIDGCGNRVIAELLEGLIARITFLRARSMSRPGRSKLSATEMRRMLKAIESGKPRAAQKAATDHVKAAAAVAREVFGETAPAAAQPAPASRRRASQG
jgi:GntR family transcriptional regulator, trigonelline degradation regulator